MPRVTHPPISELLAMVRGEEVSSTRLHVEACRTCARRLARATKLSEGLGELAAQDAPGSSPTFRSARVRELAALSREAMALATGILARWDPSGALGELRGSPARGYALAYLPKLAAGLAVRDPRVALSLADAVASESARDDVAPVSPGEIRADARLLASQALLNLGRAQDALDASEEGRLLFQALRHDPFVDALCDYFSANALSYLSEYRRARTLLRHALSVFAEYGQDDWIGRAVPS